MVAVSLTTQAAPAGANVGDPPSVIVRDAAGIPVSRLPAALGFIPGSDAATLERDQLVLW